MTRNPKIWPLIVRATPQNLLLELVLHLLLAPNDPVPPNLQRRLGRAWSKRV